MAVVMSHKAYFELMTTTFKPTCGLELFDVEFHQKMQNPREGAIVFDSITRAYLHNGNLNHIKDYFSSPGGEHLFGKKVTRLSICNTCLKEYFRGLDQMPDGTPYIANVIQQDSNISEIELVNDQLGDEEATQLLHALDTNTKLQRLDLSKNNISVAILEQIARKVAANRERMDPERTNT